MSSDPRADLAAELHRSVALLSGERALALLSGGADSVCLVHALRELLGPDRLEALHVHHGLRAAADDDARFCAELCATLGLQLHVEHVELGDGGNLEARARAARYAAAEAVRRRAGLDAI